MAEAAFRKHMSSFRGGKKGSLIGNVEDEAGPGLPAVPDNSQFQEVNPASIPSTPKGSSLSAKAARGQAPQLPGSEPLVGHAQQNIAATSAESGPGPVLRGNHNPVRGKGKKSNAEQMLSEGTLD